MNSLSFKIPSDRLSFHFHSYMKGKSVVKSLFKPSISRGVHIVIHTADTPSDTLEQALLWLLCYFENKPLPEKPTLTLEGMTAFTQDVLMAMSQINFGQTASYGQLAKLSHHQGAYRAVGQVCHLNPLPLWIPCHRVIGSKQTLGGFAYGASLKSQLLTHEGIYLDASLDLFASDGITSCAN